MAVARAGCLALGLTAGPAAAQIGSPSGLPETIIPVFPEVGFTGYTGPGPAGPSTGGTTGATSGSGTVVVGKDGQTAALTNMLAQSYGATAVATATRLGVSAETTAAIGQAESSWRNVPTDNGTSSATGPWQITSGTFTEFSSRYGLGYTAADINNPEAQAVVSNHIIRDTAAAIEAATGRPATTLQTWTGYVMGATGGVAIATAQDSKPVASLVPARFLSNNNLPANITVGELNTIYAARLGPASHQPALTGRAGS